MNYPDLMALDKLLWDLCSAQDEVTQLIKAGCYAVKAKAERGRIIEQIEKFVQDKAMNSTDETVEVAGW